MGPRSWLHARLIDHLTATLPVPAWDEQPVQAPPQSEPEYVVIHPQPGQTAINDLTATPRELLWVVTAVVCGMTRRGVLHTLDALDQAVNGWNPHPTDRTYPAFMQYAAGGEVINEGPTGFRPYSISVTYAIDAPNQEHP